MVVADELRVFWVIVAALNVEGQRENLKGVSLIGEVVPLHVVEDGALVRQLEVGLEFGVDAQTVRNIGQLAFFGREALIGRPLDDVRLPFESIVVSHLLPLGPEEVVLLEVLLEQGHVQLLVLETLGDYQLAVFVVVKALEHAPPPTMVLEHLHHQLPVVPFPNEALVELKQTPLKVQLYLVL